MKKLLVFLFLFGFQIHFGQNKTTQYYFIRHAEKADSSKNPNLSEKGLERAQEWKAIFSEINFDAVYSTDFKRTLQTINPIVLENGKILKIYNPQIVDIETFKKETIGNSKSNKGEFKISVINIKNVLLIARLKKPNNLYL